MLLNTALSIVELWGLSAVGLLLHRLHPRFGLAPLLLFLAGLVALLRFSGGLGIYAGSPFSTSLGTSVYTPLILFVVLLLYVVNGTAAARPAILGVIGINLLYLFATLSFTLHLLLPGGGSSFELSQEAAQHILNIRSTAASTIAFGVDLFFLVIFYQMLTNRLPMLPVWLIACAAFVAALSVDSLVYHVLFNSKPFFMAAGNSLLSSLLLLPPTALYLTRFPPLQEVRPPLDILFGQAARLEADLEDTRRALQVTEAQYRQLLETVPVQVMEAELLKAEIVREKQVAKLRNGFISMISHEFRNPLAVIFSSQQILLLYDDRMNEERRLHHLEKIGRQTLHMTDLLEDLLMIGRVNAGAARFEPKPAPLDALCVEVFDEIKNAQGASHQMVFDSPQTLQPSMIDPKVVRHILINLLSNAVKYSSAGSAIRLELGCENETVILRVRDYGIGIPKKDQEHLYDLFHRASNVGEVYGTGLGLAIVKLNVELHGGTIEVESAEGKGTTFTVRLPHVPVSAAAG